MADAINKIENIFCVTSHTSLH